MGNATHVGQYMVGTGKENTAILRAMSKQNYEAPQSFVLL
jgi:hypothetical protein